MSSNLFVIYHKSCADGFGGLWSVWSKHRDIEHFAGDYKDKEPPYERLAGKHVVLVDFCYPIDVLSKMTEFARTVTVIDHHDTARAQLAGLNNVSEADCVEDLSHAMKLSFDEFEANCEQNGVTKFRAWFTMDKSGARMAWDYFHPGEEVPEIIRYIEDRDLWRFALHGTKEVMIAIFSFKYDLPVWDDMMRNVSVDQLRQDGPAIWRKHMKDIDELIEAGLQWVLLPGPDGEVYRAPCLNVAYMQGTDSASRMLELFPEAEVAVYYWDKDGERQWGLRSRKGGPHVGFIAKMYGGGGHENAAGFHTKQNWHGQTAGEAGSGCAKPATDVVSSPN